MSQVAVLDEVSFQIASDASSAYLGGLVAYSGSSLTIIDSSCKASFNSDVSPVIEKLFQTFLVFDILSQ